MSRYMGIIATVLFLVLGFSASYQVTTHVVSGDNEPVYPSPFCHLIDSNDIDIPEGFASPIYQHGYNKGRVAMNVYCLDSGAFITIGTGHPSLLVYRYGYEWIDGRWQKIEYWGGLNDNPAWLNGAGLAQLSAQGEDFRTTNSVVAYTCVQEDGDYRCGCRDEACEEGFWQLQQFGTDEPIVGAPTTPLQVPSVGGGAGAYEEDTVYVTLIKPRVAAHGDSILVAGANYDAENNTLHFGDQTVENVAADSSGTISFTIPDSIEPGWYDVYVSNSLGKSEYGSYVVVTEPGAVASVVDKVTPNEAAPGDILTIHGEGFTDENNVVYTSFKVFTGLSSKDGKTITFEYDPFMIPDEYKEYFEDNPIQNIDPVTHEPDPISWPIALWVANANGESNKVEMILTY